MLKELRNKTSGFASKLILGLVVLAFVATGFAGFFQGTPSSTVVAAGRTQLGIESYMLAWRQAEVAISQRLQRRPSREEAKAAGIEPQVMSQLVTEAALDEQARRLDLGLSEDRLAQLIAEDPSFHDAAGNFSRANFRELLSSVGMTENEFIRNRQQAAIRSQIVDSVARGATVPVTVKTAFGLYTGERRTADYVTLPVSLVEPVAEPTDDALSAYFEKNKLRYGAPEYRSVSYVTLTPETLANPSAVTDDAIRQDYDRGKQRYTTPERRQVQQLLFPDAAAAEAAKAQVSQGKSFDDLVAASGRTLADTDLGLRAKSEIPDKAIADAAFALGPNQVSTVVNGTFGPVLLRVAAIEPERVKPLDEVKDRIRQELALTAAGNELQQAQDAFDDARAGGGTMPEAAQRAGLPLKTIPAVSRSGEAPDDKPVRDLPNAAGFLDGVFTAEIGTENPAINIEPSGSIIYDVTKIDPARERKLDEVKPKVIADWKADEAQRLLGERAEALKKRLDGGETLDQIVAAEKLSKEAAPSITRQSGATQIGPDGVKAVFAGSQGLTAVANGIDGTSRILLKVTSVAPPVDPLQSVGASDARQLDQFMQNDLLETYVDGLRDDYKVVSYPQAVERAQASIR